MVGTGGERKMEELSKGQKKAEETNKCNFKPSLTAEKRIHSDPWILNTAFNSDGNTQGY